MNRKNLAATHMNWGFMAVFLWSMNFFIVENAVSSTHPVFFTLLRLSIAVPLMVFFRPQHPLKHLLIVTLFWNVGTFNFIALALEKGASPSSVSIIQQSNVLFLLIFSKLFFHDKLKKVDKIYVALSLLGIVIFFLPDILTMQIDFSSLFVVFSALSWSPGMTLIRKFQINSSFNTVLWLAGVGALIQLPLTFLCLPTEALVFTKESLGFAVLSFLMSSICANACWFKASQKLKSETLSQLVLLIPVIVIFFDIQFHGRYPSVFQVLGGVIIMSSPFLKIMFLKKKRVSLENI